MKPSFTTPEAVSLWASYFSRIGSLLGPLPPDLAHELESDLTDHLAQAYMSRDSALPEVERLRVAIERMGAPEEYLRETLADISSKREPRASHRSRSRAASSWTSHAAAGRPLWR